MSILNTILFGNCLLCNDEVNGKTVLCSDCASALPLPPAGCPICGETLDSAKICNDCSRAEPAFTQTIIGLHYRWPVDWLIKQFKFNDHVILIDTLCKPLVNAIEAQDTKPDFIQAMPLHNNRFYERGYNQSSLIASYIAKKISIPVVQHLDKVKPTEFQSTLNADQRRKNLSNSFAPNNVVANRHYALVDDVMTTGSTANEAAKTLLKAGAGRVDIWLLARATSL